MERFLLDEIPISVTFDDILKVLLLDDEDDIELLRGKFEQAKEAARPKALYRVAYIEQRKLNAVRPSVVVAVHAYAYQQVLAVRVKICREARYFKLAQNFGSIRV